MLCSENRLQFRAKDDAIAVGIVVKRLLADAVTRQQQTALVAVPDDNREHASQLREALFSILLIEMDDSFGIRPGCKPVSFGDEFLAKVSIVIDFAIQQDPDGAVLVADWLMTSSDVDDAEPPMPQSDPGANEIPSSSGPRWRNDSSCDAQFPVL